MYLDSLRLFRPDVEGDLFDNDGLDDPGISRSWRPGMATLDIDKNKKEEEKGAPKGPAF